MEIKRNYLGVMIEQEPTFEVTDCSNCGRPVFEVGCYGVGEPRVFDAMPLRMFRVLTYAESLYAEDRGEKRYALHVCPVLA